MLARTGIFAASAVTWIHTPELFPTRVRATGHAVSNSSAQIGSFCAPFLINSGGDGLVGGLLGVVSMLAMLCALCLPETAGLCLDEEVNGSNDPAEVKVSTASIRDSHSSLRHLHCDKVPLVNSSDIS
mmetsp:Transcript_19839/g.36935  ORF Transcript_19839/g.36935 Transcript_19839/m.36935 type:complete len:128 (-) Transcript_19839:202-585(-)